MFCQLIWSLVMEAKVIQRPWKWNRDHASEVTNVFADKRYKKGIWILRSALLMY